MVAVLDMASMDHFAPDAIEWMAHAVGLRAFGGTLDRSQCGQVEGGSHAAPNRSAHDSSRSRIRARAIGSLPALNARRVASIRSALVAETLSLDRRWYFSIAKS